MIDKVQLGERLRALREAAGKTQGELARLLGLSQSGLSEIEHGRNWLGIEYLEPLIRHLGLNVGWLLTGDGPMLLPGTQVAEGAPAYMQPLDADLLRDILRYIGNYLEDEDREITPEKMAEVATVMYSFLYRERHGTVGTETENTLRRLMGLLA